MSTQPQPAPVLAWHRELAEDIRNHFARSWPHDGMFDPLLAIIANRCPHQAQNATTVRLLEAMLNVAENCDETGYADGVGFVDIDKLHAEIRAHLAALQQEGAAK